MKTFLLFSTLVLSGLTASGQSKTAERVADSRGFVYCTIIGADGRTWLNNNLGANYANPHHKHYNPERQADGPYDYDAYGHLFQWGRKADGHEQVKRSFSGSRALHDTTKQKTDAPANNLFIITEDGDWRAHSDDADLWGAKGGNNPCPQGFRPPTTAEWDVLLKASSVTSLATAFETPLKLVGGGYRLNKNGTIAWVKDGVYWASATSNTQATRIWLDGEVHQESVSRAFGNAVRCIRE